MEEVKSAANSVPNQDTIANSKGRDEKQNGRIHKIDFLITRP